MGFGGFRVSEASVDLKYKAEPKIVAEAIISAIKKVGVVKNVSRETGVIRAKINAGFLNGKADAVISIGLEGSLTKVKIDTRKPEALLVDSAGAQKAMSSLMDAMSKESSLESSSGKGW